ncbi:MAG: phosphoribosylglycinamide formyltransferase [Pseudomonadales bacterium]|jgi:phosphoribosylglycinamide formyltransferase-1|nr:phosphoribosylglycinamide formyltransferase [Pseudomonadales bacterium]MDP6470166.1 phosphoribosylglycinamide formyltransferase [Pseudomonadales bacterium]MDP6827072.1 phosphoribosylglycinamide formyltransferase [Pseudomonadales bacterium]|tara:strand:+ start:2212 stop:2811 length:600 start_codon:yes stop_codon:yes gene_type:complete
MTRIAALSSHGGSILQAVIDACESGELPAEVVLVISNNSSSRALERARTHDIATEHLSGATHTEPELLDQAICAALKRAEADLVLLAGYMKQLGPKTLEEYRHRILNTHPALLPKYGGEGFYGRRVHEAVIAAGESESGVTVHLVEAAYDEGPIVSQVSVPVRANDTARTLEQRVQTAERKLIVHTLIKFVNHQQASGY